MLHLPGEDHRVPGDVRVRREGGPLGPVEDLEGIARRHGHVQELDDHAGVS